MNNQKSFAPIVIVLIIVVVIGGGIFAWHYFGAEKEEVKVLEEDKALEEDIEIIAKWVEKPEEIIKKVGKWKVYRDGERGYEIKYPSALLQQSEFSCLIPIGKETVRDNQAIRFTHTFLFEVFGSPSNMDVGVEICVVEGNYQDVAEGFHNVWASETDKLSPTIWNGIPAMRTEGIVGRRAYQRADHVFFEKDKNSTVVLSVYYQVMDFVPKLKTAKEYILFDKQKMIFQEMSFTFRFLE